MSSAPRILLFGAIPPPHGGVQQHTLRLHGYLQEQGYDARLADVLHSRPGKALVQAPGLEPCGNHFWGITRQFREFRPQLVHSHVYRWRVTSALGLVSERDRQLAQPTRTVLTVHGESYFSVLPRPIRPLVYAAMRRIDHVIADNDTLRGRLLDEVGVQPERCSIEGAFLPPRADERDPQSLPADLRAFLAAHSPLLSGNGAVATFRGQDKYGVDLFVHAIAKLKAEFPNIGGVFCITNLAEPDRFAQLEALAAQLGVAERIRFVRNLPSLIPLVAAADATVRATNTDGDALSVHESLMLGTPALASDVVTRPALATLFRNRDADDLARAAAGVIRAGRLSPTDAGQIRHAGPDLLRIYERLLGQAPRAAGQ